MKPKDIILYHQEKYPDMCLQDHVKRIHQMIYGPTHAHAQPTFDQIRIYIEKELETIPSNCDDLFVPIGHDFIRVDLSIIRHKTCSIESLSQAFLYSMAVSIDFKEAQVTMQTELTELMSLIETGVLPFDLNTSRLWIQNYQSMGYPAIHHSDNYRELYHPHYRVIHTKFIEKLKK